MIVDNPTATAPAPGSSIVIPAAAAPAAAGAATTPYAIARAFYGLTKPGITRMVLVTTAAGFYLATPGRLDLALLLHTLIGIALAASGCNAFNQIVERHHDARMRRTARRPLPAGLIGHREALVFATTASTAGLFYLLAFVNAPTAALVALTIATYVFLYTPLKRHTWHATIVGAVPGALPILAGWTAAGGTIDAHGGALFAFMFLWQMPHFFALAWIYREDYRRGGFRVLPWGDPDGAKLALQVVLYAALLLPVAMLPTLLGMTGYVYLAGAAAAGACYLGLGAALALRRTERRARRLFYCSIIYLPALLALMAIDKL